MKNSIFKIRRKKLKDSEELIKSEFDFSKKKQKKANPILDSSQQDFKTRTQNLINQLNEVQKDLYKNKKPINNDDILAKDLYHNKVQEKVDLNKLSIQEKRKYYDNLYNSKGKLIRTIPIKQLDKELKLLKKAKINQKLTDKKYDNFLTHESKIKSNRVVLKKIK